MERLLRLRDVKDQVGFCGSLIRRWVVQGSFPKPIKFGVATRWKETDVQAWIARRIEEHERTAS